MITAYFMAPVRDPDYQVKWDNILFAREIGHAIQDDFPQIELFIPHDHETVIEAAMQYGATDEDILRWCCFIAARQEIGIRYEGHSITEGMALETQAMRTEDKVVIGIESYPEQREKIALALNDLRKE